MNSGKPTSFPPPTCISRRIQPHLANPHSLPSFCMSGQHFKEILFFFWEGRATVLRVFLCGRCKGIKRSFLHCLLHAEVNVLKLQELDVFRVKHSFGSVGWWWFPFQNINLALLLFAICQLSLFVRVTYNEDKWKVSLFLRL